MILQPNIHLQVKADEAMTRKSSPEQEWIAAMPTYYGRRAPVYDEMWRRDDPVRLAEQARIADALRALFRGRRVLEVACGTAYWTQFAAEVAEHVCGIDASAEMLALARQKGLPADQVKLRVGNGYALADVPGNFDAGLANFWFSHVPKARLADFLAGFHRRIGSGAVVFMADNVYIPGLGGELVARPGCADTFKRRELPDGSQIEVLKNYYDAGQLRGIFEPLARDLTIQVGECFWWISYTVR